ncbi:ATP-binding protein [Spongiactinospora sp. TRM90649]|uniref:ATP-binding protein n=1 Tax=Spongiactinospora sp. TRM90649 TaxID=3031114 RepID=UPI0023F95D2D|nr:ATP-binding protein [Spongiactinospora sp. TRM90649]MDF5752845.1 ATP-binding protein [Spongiactinospora sp. TRM90649]
MTGDRPRARVPSGADGTVSDGWPGLDQGFDADTLYALRAALEAHAVQAGLPEGRASDLVLAVHELATNVILHGSGAGRVRMETRDGMLECQVIDDKVAGPEPVTPDWPYESHHGLWIARSLADRHTLTQGPDGTTATVGFALPRPGSPFRLTRHDLEGRFTLRLVGSLDRHAAPEIAVAVRAMLAPPRRFVLDLSGMTFWDSDGIAALFTAQGHVNAVPDASMALAGLSGDFRSRLDALAFAPLTYDDDPVG